MTPRVIRRQRCRPFPVRLPDVETFVPAKVCILAGDAATPIQAAVAGLAAHGYHDVTVSMDPMRSGVVIQALSTLLRTPMPDWMRR
jgi:hypothetical protein